jgi:hypothetical protein
LQKEFERLHQSVPHLHEKQDDESKRDKTSATLREAKAKT